jgi:hypothetical protein
MNKPFSQEDKGADMKPKNFPARKNARRIEALDRITERYSSGGRPMSYSTGREFAKLQSVIVSDETARAVRTKKFRG